MIGAPTIDEHLGEIERAARRGAPADAEIVAAVRAYLAGVHSWLEELHRGGAGGQAVNEANSDAIDRLLRSLFRIAEADWYAGGRRRAAISVVAVGATRGAMSIRATSMFSFRTAGDAVVERLTSRLQGGCGMPGWCSRSDADGGDTVSLAQTDATVRGDPRRPFSRGGRRALRRVRRRGARRSAR